MTTPSAPAPDDRRGFLAKLLALGLGAVALAVPTLSALAAFLNPWRQKGASGDWVRVASLNDLPVDGTPQRFPVIADRADAWNRSPSEPIGLIFLCRLGDRVIALQSICPHAGGLVCYDAKEKRFSCPAHGALFDAQGRRLDEKGISPRDLDRLDVNQEKQPEINVKFEKFQDGTSQKIVRT